MPFSREKMVGLLFSSDWKEEEAKASIQFIDHWKTCYLEPFNVFGERFYSVCMYFNLHGDYYVEETILKESELAFRWFLEKWMDDKSYLLSKKKEFLGVSKRIESIYKKAVSKRFSKFGAGQLVGFYKEIYRLGRLSYGYGIVSEGADSLKEADFVRNLPNSLRSDAASAIQFLSTPEEHTTVELEKISLLSLGVAAFKDGNLKNQISKRDYGAAKKNRNFLKRVRKHAEKFHWMHNGFNRATYLDEKYFFGELCNLVDGKDLLELSAEKRRLSSRPVVFRKNVAELEMKHQFSDKSVAFFELLRYFSTLQDMRKKNIQLLGHCIDLVLRVVQSRKGVSLDDLYNYRIFEVIELIEKGKKVSRKSLLDRRSQLFLSYFDGNRIVTDFLIGKENGFIKGFFRKKRDKLTEASVVRGFVASTGGNSGVVSGRARIVFDPTKDFFSTGEVLITGMTRPEFVPLMKRAVAIVTNEGGITTHAAIVARELKKPCIIGTKIATEVLKNGDLIELNLVTGEVRKI